MIETKVPAYQQPFHVILCQNMHKLAMEQLLIDPDYVE